jgi:SAM-dependent methyltransferase
MAIPDYAAYREWKGWSAASFGTYNQEQAAYYEAELARTGLDGKARLDVLEIGFGNGSFAGWAQSKGFHYVGSERIPELVSCAASVGIRAYPKLNEMFEQLGAESLDLVVAFDVLEHLELNELELLLQSIHAALRGNGCVLARVPSGDSPFGRATYHGDLTHRLALGSSAVRQLALRHGFHVHDIGSPSLPLRSLGVRRALRRVLLLLAQHLVARLVSMVFHNNQPLVITSNMVFVLRKAP